MSENFVRIIDCDLDEPLTIEAVAEAIGARPSFLTRLVRQGVVDTINDQVEEPLLQTRVVMRLRRMARLRRDLGVNFAGAAVIIDLVERIEQLNREITELQRDIR